MSMGSGFLAKFHAVQRSKEWEAVWTTYHVHGGRYNGPRYSDELTDLELALNPPSGQSREE